MNIPDSIERDLYLNFCVKFDTFFNRRALCVENDWEDGSDIFLWAIIKELLVPKIRELENRIKELEGVGND